MNKVGRVLNIQNSLRKQLLLINKILEQNKAKVELQSWTRNSLLFDLNARGSVSLNKLR